jgi:hypothetical protein
MSELDASFRTELEQAIFEPKRELVHNARRPAEPIKEKLQPLGVRLLSFELVGKLPNNLILSDELEATVKTIAQTAVRVTLDLSAIEMSLNPEINIDISLLGEASFSSVRLLFGESEPRFELRDTGFGIDPRGVILDAIREKYGEAIRASAFARTGYDWTRDPRLFDNLTRFYNMVSNPLEPRSSFVENLLLESLTVSGMVLRTMRFGEETTFLSVAANSSIIVKVNFQAFLGGLIDAAKSNRQALVETLMLKSIEMQCSLGLTYEGQEIGSIESLEITTDGSVFIKRFWLTHPQAVTVERTVNAGFVTLDAFFKLLAESAKLLPLLRSQADGAALALRSDEVNQVLAESLTNVASATNAKPYLVTNMIMSKLEPILTQKIRQLIQTNLRAIPGVDLSTIFKLPNTLK